jgi:hypothetical protein
MSDKIEGDFSTSLRDMINTENVFCFVNCFMLTYRVVHVIEAIGIFVLLQIECVWPHFLLEMNLQFTSALSTFLCNK